MKPARSEESPTMNIQMQTVRSLLLLERIDQTFLIIGLNFIFFTSTELPKSPILIDLRQGKKRKIHLVTSHAPTGMKDFSMVLILQANFACQLQPSAHTVRRDSDAWGTYRSGIGHIGAQAAQPDSQLKRGQAACYRWHTKSGER